MTLDIAKFISNSIRTQAKIQHLEMKTKAVAADDVPESVAGLIKKAYGDKYLLDADYVSFFWGALGKDEIKKLFNVVDKALGKSANKLTETDFKKLTLDSAPVEEPKEEDSKEDETEDTEQEEIETSDDSAEETSSNDETLNEDEDATPSPTSHFFLKITLK